MPRVRKGSARKQGRKRLLNATKGYWGGRGNLFRKASETYVRALAFAYRDRKRKKRDLQIKFHVSALLKVKILTVV